MGFRVRALGVAFVAVLVSAALAITLQPAGTAAPAVLADSSSALPVGTQGTSVRVSTFNLLGAAHTAPGGNRRGWASGKQRMKWAVWLLDRWDIDVVGFQEFQPPQLEEFQDLVGVGPDAKFDSYPNTDKPRARLANAIAWRTSKWELVEHHLMQVPYFNGDLIRMPYVLLRNKQTGREAWFYNSHNPANARGPAQKWRDEDVRREIALVKQLRAADPDIPVFITGDKNDRGKYFCPMVRQTEMHAANGGSATASSCNVPAGPVDWIMGSGDVTFSGYQARRGSVVKKTTDHRLVFSDAWIPSLESEQSPVDHVVVVSIDGLRPVALSQTHRKGTPNLHRMISQGASTPNARTDYLTVGRVANAVSMLTGLRANPHRGGHGAGWHRRPQQTVHAAAGHYVSSVLGVTHDFGHGTAVITSDRAMRIVQRSWDRGSGAADPYVPDNGRAKISHFIVADNDAQVTDRAVDRIEHGWAAVTFVQLTAPSRAGMRYGWNSHRYLRSVERADAHLGRILRAVRSTPRFDGNTVVIATSARGGTTKQSHRYKRLAYYRVPLLAIGPGVPAGVNLYDLNPQLTRPGKSRPSYAHAQPIRTAYIANLTARLLGEPPIPGSDQDPAQRFTVLAPPVG